MTEQREYSAAGIVALEAPDAMLRRIEMYVGPGTQRELFERALCLLLGFELGRSNGRPFLYEMEDVMRIRHPSIPKSVSALWTIPEFYPGAELDALRSVRADALAARRTGNDE